MDRIEALRVFAQVADMSSYSAAAQHLRLPKATVSAAVRQLEDEVGARLLHRTTRVVRLTDDGRAFYERSRHLLADFDELQGLFRQAPAELVGRLRVDMSPSLARQFFIPRLPEFLAQHPRLELELTASDRFVDLVREGIDVVVRAGALTDSSLGVRPVGRMTLVNVVSRDYARRYGVPRAPADLDHHFVIGYVSAGDPAPSSFDWWEAGALRTRPMRSLISVASSVNYSDCCLAGFGIAQVPRYSALPLIEAGQLVDVLPQHRAPPLPLSILYPHRRHLSRRARALMDWLDAGLRAHISG